MSARRHDPFWRLRLAIAILCISALCVASTFAAYGLLVLAAGTEPSSRGGPLSYVVVSLAAFSIVVCVIVALAVRARSHGLPRSRPILAALSEAMARIASGDLSAAPPEGLRVRDGLEERLMSGLQRMTDSLRKMDEMRTRFVADVSHEMQSPLASIHSFSQILRDEGLPPERRDSYLDIIEFESGRLSRLGENLLKLSALDSRAREVERSRFRLDAQLRSVVVACEPQARDKALSVEAELEDVTIEADEELLAQAWTNILCNAIKFTPAGGRIAVSCRAEAGSATIVFSDDGIGISAEDLPRVFDRFFKADRSRGSEAGSGSGLGLAIARSIVELHGGELAAASRGLGLGSAFEASLPLANPGARNL
jgi:signal transduction histidine kinase